MGRSILALLANVAILVGLADGRTPNIVVFYADDLGNGDLGCYGCDDIRTPSIDALAASGVRFTNYYSPAPICAPSRAAMLTGRYPRRAGMSNIKNVASTLHSTGLNTQEVTFAELAKTKGYATAVFGKWHLGSTYECHPNSQGFDAFFGHLSSCIDSYSHMFYASEPYHHDLWRNRQEVFEGGQHMTDLITREATRFIDEHADDPFVIYVAYNTPHYPMVSQAKYLQMYEHLPRLRRFHAALVAGLDDSVGQIIQRLRDRQLIQDTLVFFASDNGAANRSQRGEGGGSNAPYREYKRSLFDGGVSVPGIVSWPGTIPAGQTRDQLAIGMDVFTTIADIIGAELPEYRTIDGRSWMPLLKDPAKTAHEALFFEWAGQYATRWNQWKLVRNGLFNQYVDRHNRAQGDDYIFLADTKADPGEETNLARQYPDVVTKMSAMHARWRRSIGQDPTASPPFVEDEKPLPISEPMDLKSQVNRSHNAPLSAGQRRSPAR